MNVFGIKGAAVRAGTAFALVFALSGCLSEGPLRGLGLGGDKPVSQSAGGAPATLKRAKVTPLQMADLAGGKVVVKGPRGYCIDPATLRRGLLGGFALIASCNAIAGEFAGADVEPVVMSVQLQSGLARKTAPNAEGLAVALAPEKALQKIDRDGLALVHMAGGGDKGLPNGDPKHWRGTMMINGYLVGLALYAPKGSPLAGGEGKVLIEALAKSLRLANDAKE